VKLAEDLPAGALVAHARQRHPGVPGQGVAAQAEQPPERPPLQTGPRSA